MKNFYEVLQVRSNATQMQIKRAYIELITKYHPDVYRGDKEFAQKYTAIITEAYSVLKDESKRRDYDIKHNFASSPNFRQLRKEDRQIQRARRNNIKRQGAEQQMSREYFKNSERASQTKKGLVKLFTSRLFYSLLALVGVEIIIAMVIYFK